MAKVEHLQINYKTEEAFEQFRNFGNEGLYMVEELKGKMIDASSDSPFYGIYVGDKLVARMCLFKQDEVEKTYFPAFNDYLILWKLEVLRDYQDRGYGKQLLDYAKNFDLPIKCIARNQSKDFFLNHGFQDIEQQNQSGEDIVIWTPDK